MDPKGLAIAIMRKRKGDDGDSDEGSEDHELSAAGGNVMDALKNDDPEAFTAALKEFVSMCGGYGD